jgi:hypothetical protein
MKFVFTLLFAATALVSHAQTSESTVLSSYTVLPKDSASQKVTYTAVVQVPGASQAELYGRVTEWLARQNQIGDKSDAATGMHVAHLSFKQPPLSFTDTHSNLYNFALAVYTKDGKYMYRIDDITYQNINPALMTKDAEHPVPMEYYATVKENKRVAATLTDFNKRIKSLLDGLNDATVQKKTAPKGW